MLEIIRGTVNDVVKRSHPASDAAESLITPAVHQPAIENHSLARICDAAWTHIVVSGVSTQRLEVTAWLRGRSETVESWWPNEGSHIVPRWCRCTLAASLCLSRCTTGLMVMELWVANGTPANLSGRSSDKDTMGLINAYSYKTWQPSRPAHRTIVNAWVGLVPQFAGDAAAEQSL